MLYLETVGSRIFTWFGAAAVVALAATSFDVRAQALPQEVQAGTRNIIDFEFDWGQDGVYCPTCNYGGGNNRLSFVETDGTVWVGYVDPDTGYFLPKDGHGVKIDVNAVPAQTIGNGPEWMVSQRGSELVYTRYLDNKPKTFNNLSVGFAHAGNGSWVAGTMPDTQGFVLPVGSRNLADPLTLVHYQNFSKTSTDVYWRPVKQDSVATELTIGSHQPGVTRRWVPGTNKIILTYPAAPDATGRVYRQVFLYSTGDGTTQQLTFDPTNKYWAFMWQAPEYNNDYVFFALVGNAEIQIYRNTAKGSGTPNWKSFNKIVSTSALPYIDSPEPFVHNGKSYMFFSVTATLAGHDVSASSQIAMTGIDPAHPSFRILTSDTPNVRSRRDPEYYITSNGPYIYYNRYVAIVDQPGKAVSEGVFRVDTGLGPPVGQISARTAKAIRSMR